jgi:hypothetical protein
MVVKMKTITLNFEPIKKKLIKAIRENNNLSDTHKAILETLTEYNPIWQEDLGVKRIYLKDENTIWLHTKNNKTVVNIEIRYDSGNDLYIVRFHKLKDFDIETKEFTHIFFNELYDLLREQISKLVYGV